MLIHSQILLLNHVPIKVRVGLRKNGTQRATARGKSYRVRPATQQDVKAAYAAMLGAGPQFVTNRKVTTNGFWVAI